jgi:hypothetical protein
MKVATMADKPLTWPEGAAQLFDKLDGVLKIRTLDAQQG